MDRELVLVGVGGKEVWLGLVENMSCGRFCSGVLLESENVEDLLLVFWLFSRNVVAPGADPIGMSVGDVGRERYEIAIIALVASCCCLMFFVG